MRKCIGILYSLLLVLTLIFSSTTSFAQKDIKKWEAIIEQKKEDTTHFDALIELYKAYEATDPDIARRYVDKAMELSKKLDSKIRKAWAYAYYADYYIEAGKFEQANRMLVEAKAIYETLDAPKGMAHYWNCLGRIATYQGDFEMGLVNFLEAVKIYEELNDTTGMVSAYHNIGGMHFTLERYDKAIEYWEKELEIEELRNNSKGISLAVNALSLVHGKQGNHRKAIELELIALDIAKSINSVPEIASIMGNIGTQYYNLELYDSAYYYYTNSLAMYKQVDDKNDILSQYFNLGKVNVKLDEGEIALAYYDTTLLLAEEIGNGRYIEHAYGGMADANKLLGNFELAFEYLDKWHHIKDSLVGESVKNQLNELQQKYDIGEVERELMFTKQKRAQALLEVAKSEHQFTITVILAVALLLIILLYMAYRRAREQRKRIALEQKALRTQMNPHFIFNCLGAIQQMYESGELDLANDYMADFGSLMRKILNNSGRDLISAKEEIEMLKLYLELEKGRSNESLEYEVRVDPKLDLLGTNVPPLVIQPFVENAIWHGILPLRKKGKVTIQLNTTEDVRTLQCIVEDNGVGIQENKDKKHESMGMSITEQRLGTKVYVDRLNPGTRVTFKIKV